MDKIETKKIIDQAWDNISNIDSSNSEIVSAVDQVIAALDSGEIRVSEKIGDDWIVNEWIKKAVVLYFPIQKMETLEAGIFEYHDKIPLKRNFAERGIRVVPVSYTHMTLATSYTV